MSSRLNLLVDATSILDDPKDADAALARHYLDWCAQQNAQSQLVTLETILEKKSRERSLGLESVGLAAVRAGFEPLYRHERNIMRRMALAQAQTMRGVALKMIIWRWLSCPFRDGDFSNLEDAIGFSAYRDLLRFAQLAQLAHPQDAQSWAIIRDRRRFFPDHEKPAD